MCFISYIYFTILLEFTQYILHDPVIECAQGCYVAKDVNKFATVTLGDKIETKKPTTPSAAQTPDMIAFVFLTLTASSCAAYAFGKKK